MGDQVQEDQEADQGESSTRDTGDGVVSEVHIRPFPCVVVVAALAAGEPVVVEVVSEVENVLVQQRSSLVVWNCR